MISTNQVDLFAKEFSNPLDLFRINRAREGEGGLVCLAIMCLIQILLMKNLMSSKLLDPIHLPESFLNLKSFK